jgi:periplasmic protein TonB
METFIKNTTMKKVLILLGFLIIQTSFGQVTITENEKSYLNDNVAVPDFDQTEKENSLYNTAGVEVVPQFPGGIAKFYEFIGKNYKTPNLQIGGKVYTSFVIEKDGSITDIKVLRDIGHNSGVEAIRVLKKCPKWKPAMQNGRNVRCSYVLPITIQPSK